VYYVLIVQSTSFENLETFKGDSLSPDGGTAITAQVAGHGSPAIGSFRIFFGSARNHFEILLGDQKIHAVRTAGYLSAVEAMAKGVSCWLSFVRYADLSTEASSVRHVVGAVKDMKYIELKPRDLDD